MKGTMKKLISGELPSEKSNLNKSDLIVN